MTDVDLPQPTSLRERKKARTRAAIREHALRLFREHGYDATTVEQIAAAAEVSPSTFFRYFPTKEDVVLQDGFDDRMFEAFDRQPPSLTPIAALRVAMRETNRDVHPRRVGRVPGDGRHRHVRPRGQGPHDGRDVPDDRDGGGRGSQANRPFPADLAVRVYAARSLVPSWRSWVRRPIQRARSTPRPSAASTEPWPSWSQASPSCNPRLQATRAPRLRQAPPLRQARARCAKPALWAQGMLKVHVSLPLLAARGNRV